MPLLQASHPCSSNTATTSGPASSMLWFEFSGQNVFQYPGDPHFRRPTPQINFVQIPALHVNDARDIGELPVRRRDAIPVEFVENDVFRGREPQFLPKPCVLQPP